MILVLISPRNAGLPFTQWLPELRDRLVAVTAAGVAVSEGFAEVVTVADYSDDDAVLDAARAAARRHQPRAILSLAEIDVERAAALRSEFHLPGLDTISAAAYRDKILMKKYAQAAGIRVPDFAPVTSAGDIAAFMASHSGRVVVKPRGGSGSTGVYVLETPEDASHLDGVASTEPYQVEEFVDGVLHHVDAFRVLGAPVAAVASHYTGQGCLEHWTDAPFGSRTLAPKDPTSERLVAETWRLVDALPSPHTVCVHAEFFVTGSGEIVLCEVAARVGGGPIPRMLREVLGIDPRELWARLECGLPTDLDAVTTRVRSAPLAAFYGIPPRQGRVLKLPEKPFGAIDFIVNTHVGDEWNTERYTNRKSADFLASWVLTDTDGVSLSAKLNSTAAAVSAGFGWDDELSRGCAMTHSGYLLPPHARPSAQEFAGLARPEIIWADERWYRFTERTDLHEVRYLEIRRDGQPVGLAPLLITEKPGGLLFYDPPRLVGTAGALAEPELLDPHDQQRWAELAALLPDPDQYPSLALGTFGNHHGVVHAPGLTADERRATMAALPELLLHAAAELGCRSVGLLYIGEPEAADVDESASRAGYAATLLGAEGVLELPPTSWDGYLAGLSKRRRYQTRKELRAYEMSGFRTVVRTGPDAFSEDLVALQVAHRAKYGLPGGEDRVRHDLNSVRDELAESCVVFSAERDGLMASFTLYLRTGDALFARTGGTLPDAKGCYFAVDYHETARWSLENGIRRVHYGMAAYEAKVTRGCELRPRWGWFAFTGAQADTYRKVLDLQSQSIERQLSLVGAPATLVPSRTKAITNSGARQ